MFRLLITPLFFIYVLSVPMSIGNAEEIENCAIQKEYRLEKAVEDEDVDYIACVFGNGIDINKLNISNKEKLDRLIISANVEIMELAIKSGYVFEKGITGVLHEILLQISNELHYDELFLDEDKELILKELDIITKKIEIIAQLGMKGDLSRKLEYVEESIIFGYIFELCDSESILIISESEIYVRVFNSLALISEKDIYRDKEIKGSIDKLYYLGEKVGNYNTECILYARGVFEAI